MKIRYPGPGEWSAVNFNGVLYKFTPDCEVDDQSAIDHLLASGYIQANEKPEDDVEIFEEPEKPVSTQEKAVNKPFKCPICGKEFGANVALQGHMRSHKKK